MVAGPVFGFSPNTIYDIINFFSRGDHISNRWVKSKYSRESEFVTEFKFGLHTISFPFSIFSLTVRSVKRTQLFLILTIQFLVFDREQPRTKMGTMILLVMRTANRTASKGEPRFIYIFAVKPLKANGQKFKVRYASRF